MARDPPAKSIDPPAKRVPRDPPHSSSSSSYEPKSTSGGTISTQSQPKFRRASTCDFYESSRESTWSGNIGVVKESCAVPPSLTSCRGNSGGFAVDANSGSSSRQNKRKEKVNKALQSYLLKKKEFGMEGDHGQGKDCKSSDLKNDCKGRKKHFNLAKHYHRSNSAPDPDDSSDLIFGFISSLDSSPSSCSCSSAAIAIPSEVSPKVEDEEEEKEEEEHEAAKGVKHRNREMSHESLETSTRSVHSTFKSRLKGPKFSQRQRSSIHSDSKKSVEPARRVSSTENLNKSLNGSISWIDSVPTFRPSIDSSKVKEEAFYVDDDDLFGEYAQDVMDKNGSQMKSSVTTSLLDAKGEESTVDSPAQRQSSAADNRRKKLVREESRKVDYFKEDSSKQEGITVRSRNSSVSREDVFYKSSQNSPKRINGSIDKILVVVNSNSNRRSVRGSSRRQSTGNIICKTSWKEAKANCQKQDKKEDDVPTVAIQPDRVKISRRQSTNSILKTTSSLSINGSSSNIFDEAQASDRRTHSRLQSSNVMGNNHINNDNNINPMYLADNLTINQHEAALRSSMTLFNALASKREKSIISVGITATSNKPIEKRKSIVMDTTNFKLYSESGLSPNFSLSSSGKFARWRPNDMIANGEDDCQTEGKSVKMDKSYYMNKISSILYL